MQAEDKQRWIVKSVLPPSPLLLPSKLQRIVLSRSGIKMSSQHRLLINLILQPAAKGCMHQHVKLWVLRKNNDLLWLLILFKKHLQM